MNKYTFFLFVPIVIARSMISISSGLSQNVIASQMFCPPVCLDEVQQHVNDAKDALKNGNIVQASSQLDIVDRLLDQLDATTSKSD